MCFIAQKLTSTFHYFLIFLCVALFSRGFDLLVPVYACDLVDQVMVQIQLSAVSQHSRPGWILC